MRSLNEFFRCWSQPGTTLLFESSPTLVSYGKGSGLKPRCGRNCLACLRRCLEFCRFSSVQGTVSARRFGCRAIAAFYHHGTGGGVFFYKVQRTFSTIHPFRFRRLSSFDSCFCPPD